MKDKGRSINEIGFVISLWKNLSQYRNYRRKVKADDFFSIDAAKVFYTIGEQMFESGYKSMDQASVLSHLSKSEVLANLFEKNGGYKTFADVEAKVNSDNIDGYFGFIQKDIVLKTLKSVGIDVEKDMDKLVNMNIEQIRRFYSYQVNQAFMESHSAMEVDDLTISVEDIESLDSGSCMGFQFHQVSPILNYELLGLDRGLSFVGGLTNAGKTSFIMATFVRAWMQSKIKTCIISNEQTIMEFKRLLIAMVGYELYGSQGLSRRRLKTGGYSSAEKDKFIKIAEYSNKHYGHLIKFCKIYDYSMDDVEMIIDTFSALGFEAYIYDVFKADDDTDRAVIGEMKKASKELFKCADRNKVTVLATVQLGISFENVRFTGLSTISTSKQIVEPAHTVLLLRTLWDDEVSEAKNDIGAWRYKLDENGHKVPRGDGKFLVETIRIEPGTENQYKLCFISKTRNGDPDKVILYKFLGDYNIWVELGYCGKVSRKNRGVQK